MNPFVLAWKRRLYQNLLAMLLLATSVRSSKSAVFRQVFGMLATYNDIRPSTPRRQGRFRRMSMLDSNHHFLEERLDPSDALTRRSFSASTFDETALGSQGKYLLEGLDVYTVPASEDGHPLAVYGIGSQTPQQLVNGKELRPILLLHGRTWSSVPVYHLHLRNQTTKAENSRSLMEALLQKGLQPYAMDFRGFGGTPHDDTKCVEPNRCVEDAESVLRWIADRHGMEGTGELPILLGWSQGALVAQLAAQKTHPLLSKLVLYGSIYDPLVRYMREPLYASKEKRTRTRMRNSFDDAIEDFTLEGTIPPEPAKVFAEAALITDPIKAQWVHTYQFNNCDPARVHVPTLVIAGDQDPYAPLHVQQELFTNLARGCDRTWSILSNCDHAVHLLEGRERMINIVVSFAQNGKRTSNKV